MLMSVCHAHAGIVLLLLLVTLRPEVVSESSACNGRGSFDSEWDECTCHAGYTGDSCETCAEGFVGWPSCAWIPQGTDAVATMAFGWQQLCGEVAALRAKLPDFVAKLGEPYEARQTVIGRRLKLLSADRPTTSLWGRNLSCNAKETGPGPWRLKVDLAAPQDAPAAFRKHHRVLLIFAKEWPLALPTIRFLGKIGSVYAVETETEPGSQDLHVAKASGLLLRRLQEAAGSAVSCMWRQTGGCVADGTQREPGLDKLCSESLPTGASGFCDCDGNDVKSPDEPGFVCDSSPGSCDEVCPKKTHASTSAAPEPPRHGLRAVLLALHRSLGGPLHPSDAARWRSAATEFEETASTVVKYARHGPRHSELFRSGSLREDDAIDQRLRSLLRDAMVAPSRESARHKLLSSGLVQEVIPEMVYSFPVFTSEFCELLMEEIRHFYASKLPARRPNSMNNYGIILNDIGLESLVFDIQDSVIQPLAALLLPLEGSELESHHSFTIRYKGGEDTHLDVHTDDSDVTFNVNIFGNYTGAPLVFCGLNGQPDHRLFRVAYQHQLGHAVLHRGRHRHGAEDIASGERMNLVVWSYSYNYRSSADSEKNHQQEERPPDERCVSYTHDRDFGKFRSWPEGKKERFLGRGWCPPRGKEYVGFVPDVSDEELRAKGYQRQGGGQ
eukprot:TRINITY_DN43525_c0_g1_i1.p1 TRINITY_DN43525_c0_g1~~TRINITY_DN43525_c0_g1_i1.p1  ORF type:complete len:669 (+),score=104.34 TRINITY_DN43525_c0_g1_i1:37-2043(+)